MTYEDVTKTDKMPEMLKRLRKNAPKREITDATGKVILKKIESDESCSDSEILTKDITINQAKKFYPSVKMKNI